MEPHPAPGEIPTIPQRELRNDVSRILREVRQGAVYDVTVDGQPIARLSPIETKQTFVPIESYLDIMQRHPLDAAFMDDLLAMRRESNHDINPYND